MGPYVITGNECRPIRLQKGELEGKQTSPLVPGSRQTRIRDRLSFQEQTNQHWTGPLERRACPAPSSSSLIQLPEQDSAKGTVPGCVMGVDTSTVAG